MNILFVCLGNICRSPIAHGILQYRYQELNIMGRIDSAATSSYHKNEPPHFSSQEICQLHGINISNQRSRQICENDLDDFDIIYTMDYSVDKDLKTRFAHHPKIHKIKLITEIDENYLPKEVPDPYYGGKKDFVKVFSILDDLCKKITNNILQQTNY